MRQTSKMLLLLACGIGIAGCQQQSTQVPPPDSNASLNTTSNYTAPVPNNVAATPTTQPDNTGINTRDQSPGAVTAGSQGQSKSDVDITADIRRRVMNGNLSINAQNAKIITQDGRVTLRGPVNTQDEKDSIGRMADDEVGAANVDNELEVKPND